MQLNYSTALFLLNPKLRAIKGAYDRVPTNYPVDGPQPKDI